MLLQLLTCEHDLLAATLVDVGCDIMSVPPEVIVCLTGLWGKAALNTVTTLAFREVLRHAHAPLHVSEESLAYAGEQRLRGVAVH